MYIEHMRVLCGPNVWHHRPVLVARLDLEALTRVESCAVEGFADRLVALLPGLRDHRCSRGRPGGFVERLREGTYFGHVTEHVALELSELAGIGVTFGKARRAEREGLYHVVVRYRNEAGMRYLVHAAVALVEALVEGEPYPLEDAVAEARRLVRRTALGPSTRAIVQAAERRGIPWERAGEDSLVRFGYGVHRRSIRAALTSATGAIGVDVARDKDLTKEVLREAFVPVPQGAVVRTEDEAVAAFEELGGPVVVKPLDGNQGRGVTVGVTAPEEARAAFRCAAEHAGRVLVEEQLVGQDYRVLVVGGRLVAASERSPSHVVGDGTRTIAALTDAVNADPRRGEGHEKPLTRIVVDDGVRACLRKQGWSLDDVPPAGTRLLLCGSANLSKGGTARDVTDEVHPEVRAVCERAARAVGLDVCGIDLVAEDITRPLRAGRGGVVEVNASPGLRMHLYPSEGRGRAVGEAIVDLLYPPGTPSRIPITAITGTNGKTTVTRLIGHVLRATGRTVGMTTTSGVWVGETCIARGDMTGAASARAVLSDPAVEAAVLETARGGIVRRGLGYDWADVAVVTNVRADHLGQDGIETIDDIVHIKALVAERVRDGGTLVVNADDAGALQVLARPAVRRGNKRLVYFSLDPHNPVIRRHLAGGGTAFFARDGWIVEAEGAAEAAVMHAAALPITFGGHADFQVANLLAAVAACRAQGVPAHAIAQALCGFKGTADNSGRVNLYRLGAGYVLLDYGHNPDAFEAMGRFLRRWQPERPLIGVVNVPGDRSDALIRESGRAVARAFDRLVLSEDKDLRGRAPDEVLALLQESVAAEGASVPVEVIPDEVEALRAVLDRIRRGAVAVNFYEHLAPLLALLEEAGAEPVEPFAESPSGDGVPPPHAAVVAVSTAEAAGRHASSFPTERKLEVMRNGNG